MGILAKLSKQNKQPQRARSKKRKRWQFLQQQNQFDKELVLRKKSLEDLKADKQPTESSS